MKKLINYFLDLIKPLVIWWGSLHFPFSHKKITGEFYYKVRDSIEPGTVLLTTTYGEFSNLINPAEIKHGAIYIGREKDGVCYVVEAVGSGVRKLDLVSFLLTKDVVLAVKPKFLTDEDRAFLPNEARKLVGVPYDFLFEKGGKALYCFEAVVAVFKALRPELKYKCREIIKGKQIYDHDTFLKDKTLFKLLFDSREGKL